MLGDGVFTFCDIRGEVKKSEKTPPCHAVWTEAGLVATDYWIILPDASGGDGFGQFNFFLAAGASAGRLVGVACISSDVRYEGRTLPHFLNCYRGVLARVQRGASFARRCVFESPMAEGRNPAYQTQRRRWGRGLGLSRNGSRWRRRGLSRSRIESRKSPWVIWRTRSRTNRGSISWSRCNFSLSRCSRRAISSSRAVRRCIFNSN